MFFPSCTLALFSVIVSTFVLGQSTLSLTRDITTVDIKNCSGNIPPAKPGYSQYFSRYGPQVQGDTGWETWTLEAPGDGDTYGMIVLQWARGDPASPTSNPSEFGTFSVSLVSWYHGNFTETVTDKFLYNQTDDSRFSISISNNTLRFDGTLGINGGWNVSVDISGLKIEHFIDPVLPNVLHNPTYNGIDSQLVDGFFTNFPVTRGHVDGVMTHPSGYVALIHSVGTIRHTYGFKPMQDLLSGYFRGTVFSGPYQHINWIQAEGVGRERTETAQLVSGDLNVEDQFNVRYQITNEPSLLKISRYGFTTTVELSGCNESQENPFLVSAKLQVYGGTLKDSAGGRLDYYVVSADTWLWTADDHIYAGNYSQGVYEIYTPPP